MSDIKQVIVVRKDLNMRKGKLAAQCCHASMKIIMNQMSIMPEFKLFDNTQVLHYSLILENNSPLYQWLNNDLYTKIVVGCNSEQELLDLHKQANEAGIVSALIQDVGLTEFKGICLNCEGSGHVAQVNASGYKDLILDVQCHICKGTGKISKPTYTCLAIGPDYSEKIDKITGHLNLL